MKKILAIVLAAVLCMSLTTAAFAAEADPAADLADTLRLRCGRPGRHGPVLPFLSR